MKSVVDKSAKMREKENKTIQGKFKQMFKSMRTNPGSLPQSREFILTNEILRDLGKDAPTNTRVKTMKELSEHLQTNKLEANGVEKIWSCVQDMFLKEYSTDVRHATFAFLQAVIRGQFDRIDIMRAQFFRFIKHHENPQDLSQRVELLGVLTNDGKEVEHFEEEIGPFLLNWFVDITSTSGVGKLLDFLKILDNIIKFNSPHLDEYIMTGYVKHVCVLSCNSNQFQVVILCLQILGTVVAYSILPPQSLTQFVGTLCRTVNVRCYCAASWKTMKNLLGTHLGHSTIFTMCRFLQEPNLKNDATLMRGCVFYIHMALWDINSMQNLCCPPSSVLPSILQVVKCNHPSVAYEVILGIQKLINKHGLELLQPTWDVVLQILLHTLQQIELAPNEVPNNLMVVPLHEILNTTENLIEVGSYKGSIKHFFEIIHECAPDRPDSSVLKLVNYLSKNIRPTEHGWLQNLYNLLTDYFRPEMRTNVRLKVLSILTDVIQLNRQYEDEIIDRIVLPHVQNIPQDDNVVIRSEVGKLLVKLSMDYNSSICLEMLEILEKLLLRPYERISPDNIPTNEAEFFDINAIVPGLIKAFTKKLHRLPSTHAIKMFNIMLAFLERHFQVPVFKNFNETRLTIWKFLLSIRANNTCHLGCVDTTSGQLKFSPYLCVTYRMKESMAPGAPPPSPTLASNRLNYISLDRFFKLIMLYLEKEKDWEVLKLILQDLPNMLSNKPIILSDSGNFEINTFVDMLCSMLQDKNYVLPDVQANTKIARKDFQSVVISVLICLPSYSTSLDQFRQQTMVNTLTKCVGLDPRGARQAINALTISMVDMRETMMKLLPDVLLKLSKISATPSIARPILEFLSTLSQLPTVYGNFVGDQYMAVFAIALPYTNPFRYDHCVVSLAYHVISVWFLKCRLPFRKDFVKFITSGLQTNVLIPFKELNQFKLNLSAMNQDSSDRKRSSSLTEPSSRRRVKVEAGVAKSSMILSKNPRDKTVLTFYEELNETCIDLMARYTYSPCSALPKRLPTAEFLLCGGVSKSWLLGNKLITITTSGCTEKVLKHGVCDKCWTACSSQTDNMIARYARSNSDSDDKDPSLLSRQSSSDKTEEAKKPDSGGLPKLADDVKRDMPICACWCQGWAEILIRRPTGNVSWVMKIQNQVSFKQWVYEFPLNEMATLFMPELYCKPSSGISIEEQEEAEALDEAAGPSKPPPVSVPGSPTKQSLSRQSSRDSADEDLEFVYDDGSKSRNPVRRSNSSPEMANWKNPFIHLKQTDDAESVDEDNIKKNKKDMRVSCEAIPEEVSGAGTSPPSDPNLLKNQGQQPQHPSLLTCHSYPGSSPPTESGIAPKPYKTVPPSPNQIVSNTQSGFLSKSSEKVLDRPNNLPNLANLAPLSSKPPQSPTQTSPRLQRHLAEKDGPLIQKSSSSSKVEKARAKSVAEAAVLSEKRDRLNTVSVMSGSSRSKTSPTPPPPTKVPREIQKSGLNPSFIFLQLYHSAAFGKSSGEEPLQVHPSSAIDRAVNILDRMYPYEVHKIGVVYVNEGQANNEAEILRNTFGCLRYVEFLQNLGTLIRLADVDPHHVYLGGLNQNGTDGKYMYHFQDDLVMLAFHVATLIPLKEHDVHCVQKKAHIGNDNVVIVYNNSGEPFDVNIFKSQVTIACIIVEPLPFNCNRVQVKLKTDALSSIGPEETIIVSDQSVSMLVRQLAIHADLAATVVNSLRSHATDPYASNWLERLRKLKSLREKVLQENKKLKEERMGFSDEKDFVEDFTDFT